MALAIFDLDNTLIGGDSDYLWGEYLCENGIVDPEWHASENQRYYDEYLAGTLDIFAFLRFQLAPLAKHDYARLLKWREEFLQQKIDPIMLPKAYQLVEKHRNSGDQLLIITATNSFITRPIADRLGIENLIATEAEFKQGQFTGEVRGTPSYAGGKVERLSDWLNETGSDLNGSWFYSDSRNDIPLLRKVSNPVAVDPDDALRDAAREAGWPIISLR